MLSVFSRALLAAGILVASANAAYYQGILNANGPGVLASNFVIDFTVPTGPPDGTILVGDSSSNTGSFASYPTLSFGRIQDISALPINFFLTFPGNLPASANWRLDSLPNPAPAAPVCDGSEVDGDTCVGVAGSPILLTRTSNGTSAALQMAGIILDSGDGSPWIGRIEAGWDNLTPLQIATAASGGGSPVATWRASFVVNTPEPSSLFLGLTGLAGIVIGSMRRRKA